MIEAGELRFLAGQRGIESYVRHEGASFVFADMIRAGVPLGHGRFEWQPGDVAVAMDLYKPRGRADLSAADIRRLNWRLLKIKRVS